MIKLISNATNTNEMLIKEIGYEFNSLTNELKVEKDNLLTITDLNFKTFQIDTNSNMPDKNYVCFELKENVNWNNFYLKADSELLVLTSNYYEDLKLIINFYKINGFNNYGVVIYNKSSNNLLLTISNSFIKLEGNHLNNVNGQIIGKSSFYNLKQNLYRQFELINNSNTLIDNLIKPSNELTMNKEDNNYVLTLKGL